VVTPEQRRTVVALAVMAAAVSERVACRYLNVHRSLVRYRSRRGPDTELREELRALASDRPRWGSPRLTWLIRRDGRLVNHKRVERLYREEGLAVRSRRRKRVARARVELPKPSGLNERWSMDFMRDTLANGRVFRTFNVVDDFSREGLAIEPDFSLTTSRVVEVLDQLGVVRGFPGSIVLDNGPEFTSQGLDAWAHRRNVRLQFIRPGKPVENAFIESFNGRFRDECLNQHWFLSLNDARRTIEQWRRSYNEARPHSGLGGCTPLEFVQGLKQRKQEEKPPRLSA
jgi:putative transposase